MLEILALIFLTKNIGALAVKKGLKPGTWKLYTVLLWFGAEIGGIIIGVGSFGTESYLPAIVIGLGCAITSYFILRSSLSRKPDVDDDINYIGKDMHN